jgi:LuxR family transcriptional regulator, maltose regulon positive regulatory protein
MVAHMGHESGLRVVLLGAFQVWVGDRAVEPSAWRLSNARDVIKLLALARGRRMQRDEVIELLWPDSDIDSAANNLYQVLHAARRAIDSVGGDGPRTGRWFGRFSRGRRETLRPSCDSR